MRRFGVLCASAILILSVSACGDDDSSGESKAGDPATPTSSATAETPSESPTEIETPTETDPPTDSDPVKAAFCTAATGEGFSSGGYTEIKGWADTMEGVTVPDDMDEDAQAGMTVLLEMIDDAKSEKDLDAAGDELSPGDQQKVSAFLSYVGTNCE